MGGNAEKSNVAGGRWELAAHLVRGRRLGLAMPKHSSNIQAAKTLKRHNFEGVVTATGKFDDEVKQLRDLGLDTAFNIYPEAGSGFAEHVFTVFSQQRPDLANSWRKKALKNDENKITWPRSPKLAGENSESEPSET